MANYNLNFHETFLPDITYLSKILLNADMIDNKTKEEISGFTGIPTGKSSGKVVPHIEYLKFMNLIEYEKSKGGKFIIKRTSLGNKIIQEDPYMNERITKIMINYFLTSKKFGAEMWNLIFREFPYVYGTIIDSTIVINEIEKYYGKKVKLGAFNSTYGNSNSFSDIEVLRIKDEKYEFNSLGFEYEGFYMYFYTLLAELEALDSLRKEFTYNEIFHEIKWNIGFQWSEVDAIEVLERFESKGLISINRQLNPTTVILNVNSIDICKKIYGLLI